MYRILAVFIDQLGYKVELVQTPKRIVSLVPSQTELLVDLGLGNKLVGRTKFCIHPAKTVGHIPIIGGTKRFNFDKIDQLQPDLLVGNKEENYKEGILQLKHKYPVWMSDIYDLPDALWMIEHLGKVVGHEAESRQLSEQIAKAFDSICLPDSGKVSKDKVIYLIWRKPYMAVGPNTFVDSILKILGFENAIKKPRYPEISVEDIVKSKADRVLLSSEPFPFATKHLSEFQELLPSAKIEIVDGECFSWYGSRLLKAADYFKKCLRN